MRVLNLYAGLGGNRKLWGDEHHVTAVESREEIAKQYAAMHPNDRVVIGDAHDYLEKNFDNYDFIWSSPPCQSHSRAAAKGHNQSPRYSDMSLYQEVIFLKHYFAGKWVVENVVPYYGELIPAQRIGRHLFWANFHISAEECAADLFGSDRESLEEWLGFGYEGNIYYDGNHDPLQVLRNCVHPSLGLAVIESAMGIESKGVKQKSLDLM